jgi:hypothetical protein
LLLLRQTIRERDLTGKPGPNFSGPRSKPWILIGCSGIQKGSPAKRTGHAFTAAQYSQESPKNNRLLAVWLADLSLIRAPLAAGRRFTGIDPAQDLLEVVFDRFITLAGPQP